MNINPLFEKILEPIRPKNESPTVAQHNEFDREFYLSDTGVIKRPGQKTPIPEPPQEEA